MAKLYTSYPPYDNKYNMTNTIYYLYSEVLFLENDKYKTQSIIYW